MEAKGKIVVKKSDNKAFKLGEDWYNVNDNVIPILTKMNKGDDVVVTYEKKGVARYVSNMVPAGAASTAPAAVTEEKSTSSAEFKCVVCQKPLKDGKYKKCYDCNKSGASVPASTASTSTEFKCTDCGAILKDNKYTKCFTCNKKNPEKKTWGGKGGKSYDSPEKTAQIQRGNALNAAASVASGQQLADPDTAAQYVILLAQKFLDWLRLTE
jgi:hypothetical protein